MTTVLGRDPQPADMQHDGGTGQDSGGVHINSGIPNHAFYLVATRLAGMPGKRPGSSGTTQSATRV